MLDRKPEEYHIKWLDLFDERWMHELFIRTAISVKMKVHMTSIPAIPASIFQEKDKEMIEVAQKVIDLFNHFPHRMIANINAEMKAVKRFVEEMSQLSNYESLSTEVLHFFFVYFRHVLQLPNATGGELNDICRHAIYLPMFKIQSKKKQLITGIHSETKKYIFSMLRVAYPTVQFLKQTGQFEKNMPEQDELLARTTSGYFIYPLISIWKTFTEKDQDFIPQIWSSPLFSKVRSLPDLEKNWWEYLIEGLENQYFVMPEEGIDIECIGFDDVVFISMKEVFYENEVPLCYAKVTFRDNSEDAVIFNIRERAILCSGYGDMFGYDQDRVLKIVSKAYHDVISARKIVTKISEAKEPKPSSFKEIAPSVPSSSSQGFVFIPRRVYEGNRSFRKRISQEREVAPHPVIGHLRRLPKGKASKEAKEAALSHGIVLPDGYTFVAPYQTGTESLKTPLRQQVKMKLN